MTCDLNKLIDAAAEPAAEPQPGPGDRLTTAQTLSTLALLGDAIGRAGELYGELPRAQSGRVAEVLADLRTLAQRMQTLVERLQGANR